MRRIVIATAAALAVFGAITLTVGRADAMALSTPAGIQDAIDDTGLVKDVAYVCRRVWVCGYYGCGWRRSCYWTEHRRWRHRHYYRHHW